MLSWGFDPSSALVMGSDLHRAYLTRLCCALRFSQPLSALFLPEPSRSCFIPVALMGFRTLQSFPLLKVESPFGFPSRLDVATSLKNAATVTGQKFSCSAARLHGFSPFSSPFIHHQVLPRQRSRCSPGVHPLQGVLPLRLRKRLRVLFLLRTF